MRLMAFNSVPLVLSTLITVTAGSLGQRMQNYFQSADLHKGEFAYGYTILHPAEAEAPPGRRSQRRAADADGVLYGTHHSRMGDGQQSWGYFITQGDQLNPGQSQYHVHRVQGTQLAKRQGRLADGKIRTEINYAAGKQPIVVKVSPRPFVPFPEIVRPYSAPSGPRQSPSREGEAPQHVHGAVGGLGHPSSHAGSSSGLDGRPGSGGSGGFAQPSDRNRLGTFSGGRPQEQSGAPATANTNPTQGSPLPSRTHPFDRPALPSGQPGFQPGMVVRDGQTPGPPLPETVTGRPLPRPSNGGLREVYRPKPSGVFYVQGRTNPNRRGLAADASSLNDIARVITTETPLFGGQVTLNRAQEDALLRFTSSHTVSRVDRPSSPPDSSNSPREVRQGRLFTGGWQSGLLGIPPVPVARPVIAPSLPQPEEFPPPDGLRFQQRTQIRRLLPQQPDVVQPVQNVQEHDQAPILREQKMPGSEEESRVDIRSRGQPHTDFPHNDPRLEGSSEVMLISARPPLSSSTQSVDSDVISSDIFTTNRSLGSAVGITRQEENVNSVSDFTTPSPVPSTRSPNTYFSTFARNESPVTYRLPNDEVPFPTASPGRGLFRADGQSPSATVSTLKPAPSGVTYRLPNGSVTFPVGSSSARPSVIVDSRKPTSGTRGSLLRVVRLIEKVAGPRRSEFRQRGEFSSKSPLPVASPTRVTIARGRSSSIQPTRNTVPLDFKRRRNNIRGPIAFTTARGPSVESRTSTSAPGAEQVFVRAAPDTGSPSLVISDEFVGSTRRVPYTSERPFFSNSQRPDILPEIFLAEEDSSQSEEQPSSTDLKLPRSKGPVVPIISETSLSGGLSTTPEIFLTDEDSSQSEEQPSSTDLKLPPSKSPAVPNISETSVSSGISTTPENFLTDEDSSRSDQQPTSTDLRLPSGKALVVPIISETSVSSSLSTTKANSMAVNEPVTQAPTSLKSSSTVQPINRETIITQYPELLQEQTTPESEAATASPSSTTRSRRLRPGDFSEVLYYSGPPILSRQIAPEAEGEERPLEVTTTPRSVRLNVRRGRVLEVTSRSGAMPSLGGLRNPVTVLSFLFLFRFLL